MKKDIHPKYHQEVEVKCSCGNVFTIGSAKDSVETEICSNCHPFYTGKEKLIDKAGQVQKFKDRLAKKK
ncbi:50S ribosomal protein L31 [Candidatus Parcubacteria bacterium]|nr:50S ribosomal protein L31 [Patescibacteria group bacterium]MCG2688326.1 50S ribosomal protein L31 [Candidatus Parcubacteria bacterium]